jgi:hypothetical protein
MAIRNKGKKEMFWNEFFYGKSNKESEKYFILKYKVSPSTLYKWKKEFYNIN